MLYVSARRTFTQAQMGETGKKLGFKSYWDIKGTLAGSRRLFCQTESLHRFLVGGVLPDDTFNVVILDELESIVASLRPSTTMTGVLMTNLAVFNRLVRNADIVVAGDAFLTQRSLDVLAALRHDLAPLRLLVNHANPYGEGFQERIMKRCYVVAEKPKAKLSKAKLDAWRPTEVVDASIGLFHSHLMADLRAGIKVAF